MMWVKRLVPFVLTFVLGLFIASFFISLTLPQFKFERRQKYNRYCNMESQWRQQQERREAVRRQREAFRGEQKFSVEQPVFTPPLEPVVPRGEYQSEGKMMKR